MILLRYNLKNIKFIFFSIMLPLTFVGCASHSISIKPVSAPGPIHNLMVIPFTNISAEDSGTSACPLSGMIFMTEKVSKEPVDFMTNRLMTLMKKRTEFNVIPVEFSPNIVSPAMNTSEQKRIIDLGKDYKADAVLAGYIYRFRDRNGSRFSVEAPASVAFVLHIISVSGQRIVWTGSFDETQQSLFENLLQIKTFIKRKASWITAEQMADAALTDLIKALPEP